MTGTITNIEQAKAWDGDEGWHWATHADRYDRAVEPFHEALLAAAATQPTEAVLDVGCGCGQSTRDTARRAFGGHAHGIDLSGPMLQRAVVEARREGVANVSFEQGDAQVHRFPADAYDLVISRFGAMFFADMGAAMANIAGAVRRGGRLAFAGWTSLDRNEWIGAIREAVRLGRDLPEPQPGQPGPFGLGSPVETQRWLTEAGFGHIDLRERRGSFYIGTDADDAFSFISATGFVRGMIESLDEAAQAQASSALHATLRDHESDDGVVFDASAWIITAVKR